MGTKKPKTTKPRPERSAVDNGEIRRRLRNAAKAAEADVRRERTEVLKLAFLEEVREHGIKSVAARKLGISVSTVEDWLDNDEEFQVEMRRALTESAEKMRFKVWDHAMNGVPEPVVYQGAISERLNPRFKSAEETPDEPVTVPVTVRKYDHKLLLRELEARLPGTYKRRMDITSDDKPIVKRYINMPIEDI